MLAALWSPLSSPLRSIANSYAATALVALTVVNAAVHGAASDQDRSCIRHENRRSQHTEAPDAKPTTGLSEPNVAHRAPPFRTLARTWDVARLSDRRS